VDWNVTFLDGVVAGLLCPQCQTPEEDAEAEINEATLDYFVLPDGRLAGIPRGGSDDPRPRTDPAPDQ
jgi:hypothetical protein